MRFTIFCSLLLVGILNVRCSDFKDPKHEPVQLKEGETFHVQLEGLPEPNKFRARILFHGDFSRGYRVHRTSAQNQVSTFAVREFSAEGITDEDLRVGESYTYAIGLEQDGQFENAATVQIEVQPDVIVDGSVRAVEKPLEIKNQFRIFFKKDSLLKSMGQDTEIDVQEIYSEGGKFQTFGSEDSAPVGENGATSGRVNFRVKKITGPFAIEIRGQKGGQGNKGVTGVTGQPGANSSRSVDEGFELLPIPYVCRREWFNRSNPCPGLSYEACRIKHHPGVGGKGGPGLPGYPGNPGLIGGETLDAFLEIPASNPDLKIIYEAGAGGLGGEGGDGGPGGPGGLGGPRTNVSPGLPCDPVPSGAVGDTGVIGPKGSLGPIGGKGKLTLNGVNQ